jgi:uncharacterized membrane protein
MRVSENIQISAPIDRVWAVVSDPERMLSFMSGVTRWEVQDDRATGVGGLIEVVEWEQPCELAWTSVLGIDQRGRWRLRRLPDGRTNVELRMAYGVAGSGLWGWLAEHLAAPTVSGHLRRSLHQLKRLIEYEQLRERAAARRSAQVA